MHSTVSLRGQRLHPIAYTDLDPEHFAFARLWLGERRWLFLNPTDAQIYRQICRLHPGGWEGLVFRLRLVA